VTARLHAPKKEGTTVAALAMEGGGFRALSSDAAVIAGLLAASSPLSSSPTLAGSKLLDKFDIISSVSGSTWFSAGLIYSQKFLQLIEDIADSPRTASIQFGQGFTTPWLLAANADPSLYSTIVKELASMNIALVEDLKLTSFVLSTGTSWNTCIGALLNATCGIVPTDALGQPPASGPDGAWAEGKKWLVDHTVMLPTGGLDVTVFRGRLGLPHITYTADFGTDVPQYLPASFSVTVGAGLTSTAPVPYISRDVQASLDKLQYTATIVPLLDVIKAESDPFLGAFGSSLEELAGTLPISYVTSASSAAAGDLAYDSNLATDILALIKGKLTPWVANAAGNDAFGDADQMVSDFNNWNGVNKDSVTALGQSAVHGAVDGGFADGTGISPALAAGADEVLVILNSNVTNDPTFIQRLFPGGIQPSYKPNVSGLFPVFSAPSAAEVSTQVVNLHRLEIPIGCEFLDTLAVGSVTGTTIDNKYFGIEGGRTVTLNIINVGSSLSIGTNEDFANYNVLVQDVMDTILFDSNADFVANTLLPMVIGQ
jgi:hypothetical protein